MESRLLETESNNRRLRRKGCPVLPARRGVVRRLKTESKVESEPESLLFVTECTATNCGVERNELSDRLTVVVVVVFSSVNRCFRRRMNRQGTQSRPGRQTSETCRGGRGR